MILSILFACIFAKLKGYKLKPLVRTCALYPFFVLTVVLLYLQSCVLFGNYSWIKYAEYIKTAYLFSLIIPFLVFKLYKPGLTGAICILAGTFLNKFVMAQNGGKMPVYATLSKLTGYYSEAAFAEASSIHVLGSPETKFKILTDYIDVGYTILSIGDLLIHFYVLLIFYHVIKVINEKCVTAAAARNI